MNRHHKLKTINKNYNLKKQNILNKIVLSQWQKYKAHRNHHLVTNYPTSQCWSYIVHITTSNIQNIFAIIYRIDWSFRGLTYFGAVEKDLAMAASSESDAMWKKSKKIPLPAATKAKLRDLLQTLGRAGPRRKHGQGKRSERKRLAKRRRGIKRRGVRRNVLKRNILYTSASQPAGTLKETDVGTMDKSHDAPHFHQSTHR